MNPTGKKDELRCSKFMALFNVVVVAEFAEACDAMKEEAM